MLNEVMFKFAELLEKLPEAKEVPQEITLLPNRFAELMVDGPIKFSEGVFVANAADEDLKALREKKHSLEDSDIINKAHPKPVYVANALGQGGLVENQHEQQEKIIQMINKRPTGQHWNVYAEFVEDLVKVAEKFEQNGQTELAQDVDSLLQMITE